MTRKPKSSEKPAAKVDGGEEERGRFAYDALDRTIHERARLGIMASLVANADGLLFPELRKLCDLTDGNLNRHLQVLQDAGLVEVLKQGEGRASQSTCKLTRRGRAEFAAYVEALERVVHDAASARKALDAGGPVTRSTSTRPGWSAT
ncbi:MAG: transcriptional regulator [Pirellulales bacterium]